MSGRERYKRRSGPFTEREKEKKQKMERREKVMKRRCGEWKDEKRRY